MGQEGRARQKPSRKELAPAGSGRPDPNLAILLREPFLAFIAELFRRLQEAGYGDLRISHLVVFQHIHPAGSRLTELALKAQITKPSMAYLVEYLEASGYVERLPDPSDGRARLVNLTERGWKQIDDALEIIAEMEAELAAAMRPAQLAALRRLLTSLGTIAAPWRRGDNDG